jgi:hypothetical protein
MPGQSFGTSPFSVIPVSIWISILLCPVSVSAENRIDTQIEKTEEVQMPAHPYIGMWVTDDGRVRHELLSNNRYDEARGNRESAYQGRYEITGNHIEYWDDTGFTADGDFVDDNTLHHGGMILRRR